MAWSGLFFVLYPYCSEANLPCYLLMWLVFSINTGFLVYCASLFRKNIYTIIVTRCKKKKEGNEEGGEGSEEGEEESDGRRSRNRKSARGSGRNSSSFQSDSVNIEIPRSSQIHRNPLKYNKSFSEAHDTVNPLIGASMTVNPIHAARRSASEKRRSARASRLAKIRKSRQNAKIKAATEEEKVSCTDAAADDDDMYDDDMFNDVMVENPMMKKSSSSISK